MQPSPHPETLLFKRLSGGPLTVLNCFPNTYEIGMASLGYQNIFKLYATNKETHTFRYFTNWHEIHPKEIDLISFSVSWELDFINILQILDKLGIPLLAADRGPEHPLIYAGGPVVTANPEPWANIFDFIAIGDAENNTAEIIDTALKYKFDEALRAKRDLNIFTEIAGVYVPSKPNKIIRQKSKSNQLAASSIIAPDSAWSDTALLEVVRSCPEMCRFCLASYLALPFRAPDLDGDLIPKVEELLKYTSNIGLLGASVSQHPEFGDLLDWLVNYKSSNPNLKVQVASMRVTTITTELCNKLKLLGVENITLAIESGSQRIRDIINKKLPQEAIYSAVQAAAEAGLRSVKLYGMVGLPYEADEDIQASVDLLLDLKKQNPRIKLTWGCSIFTPKAQTPFQDFGVDKNAEKKLQRFNVIKSKGIEVRPESFKWAQVQALISRGDRSLTDIFIQVFKAGNTGFNIYRKLLDEKIYNHFVFDDWQPMISKQEYRYPWEHIGDERQAQMLVDHSADAMVKAS